MKIVINACHGGFGLSIEAMNRFIELKGLNLYTNKDDTFGYTSYYLVPYEEYEKAHKHDLTKTEWEGKDQGVGRYKESNALCWHGDHDMPRNDPILVQVVEELGEKANNRYSELKVVEIPDDVEWQIDEYDGVEWVAEKHRTWS
jgi:hypothetical protein